VRRWLDPDKLQARNLTAGDVIRVLREQNVQVAAGQVGQPPVPGVVAGWALGCFPMRPVSWALGRFIGKMSER